MTTLVTLRAAAASVPGLVRQGNEDAAYAGRRLLAVADGMGGHAAGEVASAAVIETLRACDIVTAPGELLEVLARAVAAANAEVARRAAEDPGLFRPDLQLRLVREFWRVVHRVFGDDDCARC